MQSCSYDKLNYTRIYTKFDWFLVMSFFEETRKDNVNTNKSFFCRCLVFASLKKNRILVAVGLHCNRSKKMSKCVDPLTSRSDYHKTSPFNIHTLFSKEQIRIPKIYQIEVIIFI